MPIIFAQALMFVPGLMAQAENETVKDIGMQFQDMFGLSYNILFAVLIIIFSFFYTAITIPTNKMAEDLKRQNGFIPGVKPGHDTAELLDTVLSRITFPGSLFLALLAVFPAFVHVFGITQNWALFYGGTSLIIMVGVAIDSIQQINAYLLNHHYDGLMKTSTGRRGTL
jgi:preprotein translocase subunit SecY